MDKEEETNESAKAAHNQKNTIKPDDGRNVSEADNLDTVHSEASDLDERAADGAATAHAANDKDVKSANNGASSQTVGIP